MKKRFLTIIMSMLMVFVMMPMGTWTTYAAGGNLSQDDDGTYLIADYADLKAFAELVNDGNTSANAILTADFTCTGDDWVPIGDYNSNNNLIYGGTFDGDGHTIINLSNKASGVGANYQGLFGNVGDAGEIKNVDLKGGSITGNNSVGGVVGQSFGTITNCYNSGEVSGTKYVGGVVGYAYYGEVTNCYNTGEVSGADYIGGVAGKNASTITNCYNTGEVSGTTDYVGGVSGYCIGEINNCYNSGEVSGTKNVGGVAGYNNYEIDNSYNTGAVSGTAYNVGGVAGFIFYDGEVTNSYNTGAVSGTADNVGGVAGYIFNYGEVTNSYNIGEVSGTSDVGSLFGFNDRGTIKYCYCDKTLNADMEPCGSSLELEGEVIDVKGLTTSEMTGSKALENMVFSYSAGETNPWLTKADGKDADTSEYYWYYPHLKGFVYDNSSEVKDWPPKVTVKAEWNGLKLYTYNGSAQKPTVNKITISNGSTDVTVDPVDYTVSYYVKNGDTYTAITEDIVDVGNYKAVITFNDDGSAAGHGPIEKEFVIDKADPAIEIAPAASAITYGQSLADSTLSGGTAKSRDTVVPGTFTWSDTSVKPAVSDSNTTEYEVTFTPTDTKNYNTATAKVKLTVNKADITPSVSIQGWSYGSDANKPKVEGNTGGGTEKFLYKEKDAPDTAYTEKVPTDAGTYTVKAEVAESDNYNSGSATLDFTIAPVDMQVTSSGADVDFDGSGHSITVNAPEGASVEYSQDGGKTYSTENPVYTDAGKYSVPFRVILKNYNEYEGTEQVIIRQAPNSVSVSIEGWTYGEPAHIPAVDAKFGADHASLSYSDAPDGTYKTGGPDQAGTWYVKATVPETQDYAGAESVPVAFEIAKAQLTITAKDQIFEYNRQEQGEGKEGDSAYSDSDVIAEKVTVEGLQNNDAITSVTLTGHRKTIGEYQDEIKIAGFAINNDDAAKDNYDVTLKSGKLTITKHILTETKEVPATCEKDGTKAYWTCSECKKMFSDKDGENEITKPEVIKATGHNLTKTDEVPATCEKDGTKAYWTCSACKKLFSDEKGENEITEPEVIKATGHDWGEWVETEAATEEKEGSETRTCKNDPKHTETRAIPTTIAYRNVSGEGNTWYKGSNATSDYAFKRSIDDSSTISHFTGIRVDNNPVDEANYSKEPGSVIIKLKPEYLETLALGKHTLEARFDDGNGSATAEFTIAEAEEENTDDEDDDADDNGGGSKGGKKNVKTGDESLVAFWASLLGVSLIGLIMLFAARQRLRRKDR